MRRVEGVRGVEGVVLVVQIWVYSYFRYHMISLSFHCNDSNVFCVHNCVSPSNDYAARSGMQQ